MLEFKYKPEFQYLTEFCCNGILIYENSNVLEVWHTEIRLYWNSKIYWNSEILELQYIMEFWDWFSNVIEFQSFEFQFLIELNLQ